MLTHELMITFFSEGLCFATSCDKAFRKTLGDPTIGDYPTFKAFRITQAPSEPSMPSVTTAKKALIRLSRGCFCGANSTYGSNQRANEKASLKITKATASMKIN